MRAILRLPYSRRRSRFARLCLPGGRAAAVSSHDDRPVRDGGEHGAEDNREDEAAGSPLPRENVAKVIR